MTDLNARQSGWVCEERAAHPLARMGLFMGWRVLLTLLRIRSAAARSFLRGVVGVRAISLSCPV